jgi:NCS2 family nucleobase:cation symporter-2
MHMTSQQGVTNAPNSAISDTAAPPDLDRIVRPPALTYGVDDRPPPARLALLAFQYAVITMIYLVLVGIILRHAHVTTDEGLRVLTIACVGLGIGSILQALRGPIGSGFLALPVYSAVFLAPSIAAAQRGGMPLVYGMVAFAGLAEIIFALLLRQLTVIVTPILTGLTLLMVGLELGLAGMAQALDIGERSTASFTAHVFTGVLTLLVVVLFSIWGRGAWKMACTLLGLTCGAIVGWITGILDPATLQHAPWLAVPHPVLFDLSFDVALAPAFLASGLAAGLRAIGVITTCQRLNNAAWQRPNTANIRAGVLADGLSNLIGGPIGATGMSIGPSIVGISAAIGVTSRIIAFVTAIFLMAFAWSPKLVSFFLVVPGSVAGALLVFTAAFMIAGGMQIMLSRPLGPRGTYIVGIATLLSLSQHIAPAYFDNLPAALRSVTASPLAVGLSSAILLTLLFRFGTRIKASLDWNATEDGIAATRAFVRDTAIVWKVPPGVAEVAGDEVSALLTFLRTNGASAAAGQLLAMNDGARFRLRLIYAASTNSVSAAPQPLATRTVAASAPLDLDNEEQAAFSGLTEFLRHLAADRKQVVTKDGRVIVRLAYGI